MRIIYIFSICSYRANYAHARTVDGFNKVPHFLRLRLSVACRAVAFSLPTLVSRIDRAAANSPEFPGAATVTQIEFPMMDAWLFLYCLSLLLRQKGWCIGTSRSWRMIQKYNNGDRSNSRQANIGEIGYLALPAKKDCGQFAIGQIWGFQQSSTLFYRFFFRF